MNKGTIKEKQKKIFEPTDEFIIKAYDAIKVKKQKFSPANEVFNRIESKAKVSR